MLIRLMNVPESGYGWGCRAETRINCAGRPTAELAMLKERTLTKRGAGPLSPAVVIARFPRYVQPRHDGKVLVRASQANALFRRRRRI